VDLNSFWLMYTGYDLRKASMAPMHGSRLFCSYKFLLAAVIGFIVLIGFGPGADLLAQTHPIQKETPQLTFGSSAESPDSVVIGKPYEAHRILHTKRALADGTLAAHDFSIREARDSSGRTLQEIQSEIPAAEGKPTRQFVLITLIDPVAKTSLVWTSMSKIGTLSQLRTAIPLGTNGLPKKQEDNSVLLGHRMIHGLLCSGHSVEHVIPAGAMGNSEPITTRHEWWTNDELKFKALEIINDPQHGERTNEMVDIQQVEPDPNRFHLPSGYVVREANSPGSTQAGVPKADEPLDVAHVQDLSHDTAIMMLASQDKQQQLAGAAALVKEAQSSESTTVKDDIAYRLARANVGLAEAQSLAEAAVKSAEIDSADQSKSLVQRTDFHCEITLARYWHTLGFVYSRKGDTATPKTYIETSWKLDPLAYYGAHLARIAEEAGDTKSAVSIYRAALQASGGEQEKASIQARIDALAGKAGTTVAVAEESPLTGVTAVAGTALFDVVYSSSVDSPMTAFVSGTEALRNLGPAVAKAGAASFALPDHGPERVIRRMEVICSLEAASNSACSVHAFGAHQARTLARQQ